ncbi:hypothetical protein CONPUDRAFT_118641 [Coniophora puteana RWD-64-598 SS2]|uniref:Uncharacterized protein n=1 Tax=Coniophora puteana (strain RWD-64-598) TaxID=741705 RepID=A0A5M3N2Q8_CONPW|nr:uncharacterized protein CONPUDRAFT_118641 [Coniophora puteana RWD-64-598 SS2]EIW85669.1 hypothetical protein CONPUDRAFT_118641 [Coniophora puteana RWD-64-598 SS2]
MSSPTVTTNLISINTNSTSHIPKTSSGLPRIPFDLRAHKTGIIITWSSILLTSCLLPILGYFLLRYKTSLELTVVFAISTSPCGAVSLFSLFSRTYALFRKDSTCRPLPSTSSTTPSRGDTPGRWHLDNFNYNFAFCFAIITIILSTAISHQPTSNIRLISVPIAVLLLLVCSQLVLVPLLIALDVRAPFRFSSLAAGERLRPATFIIAEDVVAVDGGGGTEFRRRWNERYDASADFRRLMVRLDLLWGFSGLALAGGIFGVVFGVQEENVGYVVGWGAPWVWAAGMALVTLRMTTATLRREEGGEGWAC